MCMRARPSVRPFVRSFAHLGFLIRNNISLSLRRMPAFLKSLSLILLRVKSIFGCHIFTEPRHRLEPWFVVVNMNESSYKMYARAQITMASSTAHHITDYHWANTQNNKHQMQQQQQNQMPLLFLSFAGSFFHPLSLSVSIWLSFPGQSVPLRLSVVALVWFALLCFVLVGFGFAVCREIFHI